MLKKSKFFMGSLLAMSMIASSTFSAIADESVVTNSADNINVTKSAEWTTVDGKTEDSNGNKYVKITFKVDATNAQTESTEGTPKGNMDIVFIMDTSKNMGVNLDKAKADAKNLANKLLNTSGGTTRVALTSYDKAHYGTADVKLTSLSSDITNRLDQYQVSQEDGSYMHYGLFEGCDLLAQQSTIPNKYYVIFSNGVINDEREVKGEITHSTTRNKGLKIVTVGYSMNTTTEAMMQSFASSSDTRKLYFNADNAVDVGDALQNVYNEIVGVKTKYVIGNKLVDRIPTEFSVVDGSITSNDNSVVASVSDDKKTITWDWGTNKLEKKVYEMSVITVLDKNKVAENCEKIFTNGASIDVTTDASNSAVFTYDNTKTIGLNSPVLTIEKKVEEAKKETSATQIDDTPSTGDSSNIILLVIIGAVCAVAVISSGVAMKRRRSF